MFTAIGVFFGVLQYFRFGQHAITQFEDDIEREYRLIAKDIPVNALLGDDVTEVDRKVFMNAFYNYIDFSNGQIFLRQNSRIRCKTWKSWAEGIEANLCLPAFSNAWAEIKEKLPNSFKELQRLEKDAFKSDPKDWQIT